MNLERLKDLDKEILLLINMEKQIFELFDSWNGVEDLDMMVPRTLSIPYLKKACQIIQNEFLQRYKTNYTMLCNNYLKESSLRVNQLIANFVQLMCTTSSQKYITTTSEANKKRDLQDKEYYYQQSQELLTTSDEVFKTRFRDPYFSTISEIESLLHQYEMAQMLLVGVDRVGLSFFQFMSMRKLRTDLRKTIDDHLVMMLGITRVEAKFNSGAL